MEIIEFINDIFSTVSNRLFECQTIRVADGTSIDKETVLLAIPVKGLSEKDCEIYLIQDVKDAEGILFSFMMETIKECLEDIATTTERTQEIATVFAQDIYRRTCEKYIRFFNEKFHIMLDDIIAVSSMYYESEEAKGNIYFALDNIADADIDIEIQKISSDLDSEYIPFVIENRRKIRKLLEVTNVQENEQDDKCKNSLGMLFVFCNGQWRLKGFTCFQNSNKRRVAFRFTKHMAWEMYWNNTRLVKYEGGQFLNPIISNETRLFQKLDGIVEPEKIEKLWSLVKEAISQKHGTILVVLLDEHAESEANRVCKESSGTKIVERKKDETLKTVLQLSTVDGAVLVDKDAKVLAYGVLVDSKEGVEINKDAGRGSRFHAAKKYIASLSKDKKIAMAVIVSEDKMVSFYSTKDAEEEENERKNRHKSI